MIQVIFLFLFILCRFSVVCENTDYVNTIPEELLSDYEDYDYDKIFETTHLNHTSIHTVTKKYECKAHIDNAERKYYKNVYYFLCLLILLLANGLFNLLV